ncbi:MAG: hypothetical protein CMC19_10095 [Flavobacteriaceae bacterium]|nr:hypothetical protein [Flavobacteriaceae bacterium]
MNRYLSLFLFILAIASLWTALVIITSGRFSSADVSLALFNFMGFWFFLFLFVFLLRLLWKKNFFKRKS